MKAILTLSLISTLLLGGCASVAGGLGPLQYDRSGTLTCTRDGQSRACGYRVVHHTAQQSNEIWIANSRHGQPFYRVLHATHGQFRSTDGSEVRARHAGDSWLIEVNHGEETYRLPRQDLLP